MRYAGIVDQNIEPAELILDPADHPTDLIVRLNIGSDRSGLHAMTFNLTGQCLGLFPGPTIIDHDPAQTGVGQATRHRAADSAGAAGHQSYSLVKFHICFISAVCSEFEISSAKKINKSV